MGWFSSVPTALPRYCCSSLAAFLLLALRSSATAGLTTGSDDLVNIGELYEGRTAFKRWVPITRSLSAPQPYPPVSDSWDKSHTTIWAGIASFRDKRCGQTLFNMFSKAKYPDRVTAGVVQQNEAGDPDCLARYCELMQMKDGSSVCPFQHNIRVLEVDAREAQGPCWGRHLQSYLLADEEFCMQTDSHMDFVEEWDIAMMEEWAATRNEYGVLSTYVQDFPFLNHNIGKTWEVSHLCEVLFSAFRPRNQRARAIRAMTEPKLTTTWGAGFAFSKCHAERRVPYDPYLDQVFDGEEFSKMLRLWTNGYDVYTPRRGHIVHDYSHLDSGTTSSWRNNRKAADGTITKKAAADARLWNLMEMPRSSASGVEEVQAGAWGLGDRRTLDQFIEFTGVDLRNEDYIGITGDRCGSGVEWVPFPLDSADEADAAPADHDKYGSSSKNRYKKNTSFESWRTREGVDPIEAGPHWLEVKRKLESSGVSVWWDPLPGKEGNAPEAREAPVMDIVLGSQASAAAESGDGGGDDDGGSDSDSADGGIEGRAAPMYAGPPARVEQESAPSKHRFQRKDTRREGLGAGGGDRMFAAADGGFHDADSGDSDGGDDTGFGGSGPLGAPPSPARAGLRSGSWVALGGVVSCVGMAGFVLMKGQKRGRKRKRTRGRRLEVIKWTGDAFSVSGAISPLPRGKEKFSWKSSRTRDHAA